MEKPIGFPQQCSPNTIFFPSEVLGIGGTRNHRALLNLFAWVDSSTYNHGACFSVGYLYCSSIGSYALLGQIELGITRVDTIIWGRTTNLYTA